MQNGVKLVGHTNLPALVAADASALYARNVLNFLALLLNEDRRVRACAGRRDRAGDARLRERAAGDAEMNAGFRNARQKGTAWPQRRPHRL